MSTESPSPTPEGDTSEKRTDDQPTCANGHTWCPHENPAVDDGLECFPCFQELTRADERPAHTERSPLATF